MLYVTTSDMKNSTYCTPDGQVVYKVQTPHGSLGPLTTIGNTTLVDRAVPYPGMYRTIYCAKKAEENHSDNADNPSAGYELVRVGEIEFHQIHRTKFVFGGTPADSKTFFRHKFFSWGKLTS